MKTKKGVWVRGLLDADTHGLLMQAKLKINSVSDDKVKIEDVAMECIKLGLPLYNKKIK